MKKNLQDFLLEMVEKVQARPPQGLPSWLHLPRSAHPDLKGSPEDQIIATVLSVPVFVSDSLTPGKVRYKMASKIVEEAL